MKDPAAVRRAGITRERAWLAVLLAWVGGGVDGVGYLLLAHLFTAHMSGNSVGMGVNAGGGDWREAIHRGFPIPLYVVGVLLGALLTEAGVRRGVRSVFAVPLGLEASLLLAFLIWMATEQARGSIAPFGGTATPAYFAAAALPTLAMGVQNATLRRVGRHTSVRTTYVTGMLTNLGEHLAAWLCRRPGSGNPLRDAGVFGGIWLGYAAGAVLAGFAAGRWGAWALIAPLAGLLCVIGYDLALPVGAGAVGDAESEDSSALPMGKQRGGSK